MFRGIEGWMIRSRDKTAVAPWAFGTQPTADTFLAHIHGADHCHKNTQTDTLAPTGQHPEDAQDLLQGQGLQEAHPAQGHPVQGWQGAFTIQDPTTPTNRKLTHHSKGFPLRSG
jgi:hypothetical protein